MEDLTPHRVTPHRGVIWRQVFSALLAISLVVVATIARSGGTELTPVPQKGDYHPRPFIILYSDGSADHLEELSTFTKLLPLAERPKIIDGRSLGYDLPEAVIQKSTLVYFGRSSRDKASWRKLPSPLRIMIEEMRDYEGVPPDQVLYGVLTGGIWCYGDNRLTEERVLAVYAKFDPRDRLVSCRSSGYLSALGFRAGYCDYHKVECEKLLSVNGEIDE